MPAVDTKIGEVICHCGLFYYSVLRNRLPINYCANKFPGVLYIVSVQFKLFGQVVLFASFLILFKLLLYDLLTLSSYGSLY